MDINNKQITMPPIFYHYIPDIIIIFIIIFIIFIII